MWGRHNGVDHQRTLERKIPVMNINILLTVRYSYQSQQRGAGNISALTTINHQTSSRPASQNERKTVKHQTVIFLLSRENKTKSCQVPNISKYLDYSVSVYFHNHSFLLYTLILIQKLRKVLYQRGEEECRGTSINYQYSRTAPDYWY